MKKTGLFLLTVLLVACTPALEPFHPEVSEGLLTTNVVVPHAAETTYLGELEFPLLGASGLETGDRVQLRTADGITYSAPIIRIGEKSFTAQLPEGVYSGTYDVALVRGTQVHPLGRISLNIFMGEEAAPVVAEAGATVYGLVECGGKGVPDVVVSDGYEVVRTDANGVYQLRSDKTWGYVFISLPSGYEAPLQGVLPQFYARLTDPAGQVERHDFSLSRVANDHFTLFLLGDMHLANRNEDIYQFRRDVRSLKRSIDQAKGRCYVITLGDMTWDGFWYSNKFYFPEYLTEINRWFEGIPFFHTMGNHDNDMNRVGDFDKTLPFVENIGPSYYSFNLGEIHFVVTDNIDYNDVGTGTDLRSAYKHNFTANIMDWLAKDLAEVPASTPVVIAAHSPLFSPSGATTWKNRLTGANAPGEANTDDFIASVRGHDVRFIAGHSHKVFHYEDRAAQGYLEHNIGSVCGCWWMSGKTEPGIHLCPDGAPSGYAVWEYEGKQLHHRYQASGMPEDYVFRSYDMGEVKKVLTMDLVDNEPAFEKYYKEFQRFDDNDLLLNVWYWDSAWKIEVTAGGQPLPMVREYTYDPLLTYALTANYYRRHTSLTSSTITPSKWPHFFRFRMPAGPVEVTVRVTDRNGQVSTETFTHPKPFTLNEYRIAN